MRTTLAVTGQIQKPLSRVEAAVFCATCLATVALTLWFGCGDRYPILNVPTTW